MFTLKKTKGKDFIVLNLTDPQLGNDEWAEGHPNRAILEKTVRDLIEQKQPDLITVSGDISWAGHDHAYDMFADFMDSFEIPWAPVWGNHDNQNGPEFVDSVADRYLKHKYCIYEKGDPAYGNGNYVIAIEEDGKIVEGILMMDSHDGSTYVDENGEEHGCWGRLYPDQINVWYREQIEMLRGLGCNDTAAIMHIPINGYRTAAKAAYKNFVPEGDRSLAVKDSFPGADCWNPEYNTSYGVMYEGIASYPLDEGALAVIQELGSTKHLVAGHDHVNNFCIEHEGIWFIYGLKAGPGCYWTPELNGGTVLKINENGVCGIEHVFVNVDHMLKKEG